MKNWPLYLIVGLLSTVVLVNMAFMWVATQNSDPVVPSYDAVER